MQTAKNGIVHAHLKMLEIPMLNFSGWMYYRELGNVSFLLYLYGLSYKCNLIV